MDNIQIIEVTPSNLNEYGMFCNKNPKSEGYKQKTEWYFTAYKQGVRMNIAQNAVTLHSKEHGVKKRRNLHIFRMSRDSGGSMSGSQDAGSRSLGCVHLGQPLMSLLLKWFGTGPTSVRNLVVLSLPSL